MAGSCWHPLAFIELLLQRHCSNEVVKGAHRACEYRSTFSHTSATNQHGCHSAQHWDESRFLFHRKTNLEARDCSCLARLALLLSKTSRTSISWFGGDRAGCHTCGELKCHREGPLGSCRCLFEPLGLAAAACAPVSRVP